MHLVIQNGLADEKKAEAEISVQKQYKRGASQTELLRSMYASFLFP